MAVTNQIRSSGKESWSDNSISPRFLLNFSYGLNENTDPDISECISGYNFNLAFNNSSLQPRLPFDLKGTAPNSGAITGFLQLVTRANVQTTLVVAGTTVYLWDGSSTFTSKGTVTSAAALRGAYWSLGDYLIVSDVNQNNVLKKWDGTTFSNAATGLASPLIAKYSIVYLNRIWLFNITYNGVNYPHMILASAFEDPTTYNNSLRGGPTTVGGGTFATGLEAFYILVPDLKPINGVCLFANQLLISTDQGRLWNLTGTSGSTFQFTDFFDNAPSVGTEAIQAIGNDVVFLRPGGSIALLSATQAYGNVFTSNLSIWLPKTTANLAQVNQIVYDQLNQRVLFFITGKVLVLYKDILVQDNYGTRIGQLLGKSPWGAYITSDSSSFNTSAAMYMYRPGTTSYSVFWGDNIGRIMDLYGTGTQDAGTSTLQVNRVSRHIDTTIIKPWPWMQENITGRIRYHRQAPVNMTITVLWDDEYSANASLVVLKGPASNDPSPYFSGSFYFNSAIYYNEGFFFLNRASSINIEPGGKGPGFYIQLDTTYNNSCEVDAFEFD